MDWQAKKIQRTIEYVKESGKSLQEVAIERFGVRVNILRSSLSIYFITMTIVIGKLFKVEKVSG